MTTPLISTRTMFGLGEAIESTIGSKSLRAAMEASELPEITLCTKRAYLPHVMQLSFLDAVEKRTESELALVLGNELRIKDYGAFGAYIIGGQTFGAALSRAIAGISWHLSHDRMSLERRGGVMRLCYRSHVRHAPGYTSYAPLAACVLLSIATPYFGQRNVARLVRLDIPRPGGTSRWEQFFGCEVRFDCDSLSMDFDLDALSRRRLAAPPAIATLEDVMRESMRAAPRDFVGTTEQLIRLAVLDGDIRLDRIAEQLRLGPRTFRRRLEAEGVTFRGLLTRHRIERASELIDDGAHSVRDVALSLGYSDAAHFVRAFKRETGQTPGELRLSG